MDSTTAINILAGGLTSQQQLVDAMNVAFTILKTGYVADDARVAAVQTLLNAANAQVLALETQVTQLGGTPVQQVITP